jgi:NADH-quinone oxidoreductase subunit L
MHEAPGWVPWAPFGRDADRHGARHLRLRAEARCCPKKTRRMFTGSSTSSCYNKWYFDELYDLIFVRPARIGRFLWKKGDGCLIDGTFDGRVSARVVDVTNRVVKLQTGFLYHYAFVMLIGVAALITWFDVRREAVH